MKKKSLFLVITFIFTVGLAVVVNLLVDKSVSEKWSGEEKKAIQLADEWFELINEMKNGLGLTEPGYSGFEYRGLLGKEFTTITTTLGYFEAKQTAANPEFAGLILRWLKELKVGKGDVIGINLSGSFPSLAISLLASAQTLGCKVVMASSLGASMYGANEEEATWIDMENYLKQNGGLAFKSSLITLGGVNDNGGGLQEEGVEALHSAAIRNNRQIFVPVNLEEAIRKREELFLSSGISVLINIGGNHACLGGCSHSTLFPNGKVIDFSSCTHEERGLLQRITEKKIPVIHLLNIKDLAVKNGIKLTPSKRFKK
ncbi:MAG: poly-gamma-glutamate system protein [Ignavibacteriaceae bacterium]